MGRGTLSDIAPIRWTLIGVLFANAVCTGELWGAGDGVTRSDLFQLQRMERCTWVESAMEQLKFSISQLELNIQGADGAMAESRLEFDTCAKSKNAETADACRTPFEQWLTQKLKRQVLGREAQEKRLALQRLKQQMGYHCQFATGSTSASSDSRYR